MFKEQRYYLFYKYRYYQLCLSLLHIMITHKTKLEDSGTTIFTKMSRLAQQHKAINLGQGFPNYDCDPELKALVKKYLDAGKNQYAPMIGVAELREAIANKMYKSYQKYLNPDTEITITAGATQAIFTTIAAFVNAGDEVIIIEPAYDSYKPSIMLAGGRPVIYELSAPNFCINWDILESLLSDKTKMIILNTPHNPTGNILEKSDMLALQELVSNKNIIVLSDEVYEHLVYDEAVHESAIQYDELYQQCVAVYSFGKTFHSTGWKIGYAVGPPNLMKEIRKIHQWNVFSVNSFIQYALAEFLEKEENYLSLSLFFQTKRDLFSSYLESSKLEAHPSKGTYFQLYDYAKISDEKDTIFAEQLVKDHGIACIPISVFYTSRKQDNLIRFCFAKTDDVLETAGAILAEI